MISKIAKGVGITILSGVLWFVLTHVTEFSNIYWIINNTDRITRVTTLDTDIVNIDNKLQDLTKSYNSEIQRLQKEIDSLKVITAVLGRGKLPQDSVHTIVGIRYWKDKRMIRFRINNLP